jgi:hypothetical protein
VTIRARQLALVSLGITAAAMAGEAAAQSRSEWRPPEGQRCAPLPLPARLPAVSQLLDSTTALAVLGSERAFTTAYELLAIGIDATGIVRQVRVLEADLPPDGARRLAAVVAAMIELQPAGVPGQLRLAVDLRAAPYLSVSRSEFCRPSIRAGQTTTVSERIGTVRRRGGEATDVTLDRSWQELDVQVAGTSNRWLVTVDVSGRAVEATPLMGIAPQLAAGARAAVLQLVFNPALVDRVPVAMTDTVTVGGP